jgi:hypothetical protein
MFGVIPLTCIVLINLQQDLNSSNAPKGLDPFLDLGFDDKTFDACSVRDQQMVG